MNEFILISGTLIFSAIAIICLALTVHWGNRRETGIMHYFFYLNLMVYALATILSNRKLLLPTDMVISFISDAKNPLIVWLGRLSSLYILFAFSERLLHRIFSTQKTNRIPAITPLGTCRLFFN